MTIGCEKCEYGKYSCISDDLEDTENTKSIFLFLSLFSKLVKYEKQYEDFKKNLELLIKRRNKINKDKLDKLFRFTDKYGTKWLRYNDIIKFLEEL